MAINKKSIPKRIMDIIACPHCGNILHSSDNGTKCSGCHDEFVFTDNGQLDFRLRKKKTIELRYELSNSLLSDEDFDFKVLKENTSPQVNFTKIRTPWHLTKELLSYFPKAKCDESIMLDLGCGRAIHKQVCEHAGFQYVGLDYNSQEANMLGDAHALPFKDNSFEFILSIAVLEHIRYPLIMMKEAHRVLKPGGLIIGTVAFLEPFHSNSFYHHTHLGTLNSLKCTGFDIKKVSPDREWSVLTAQASMGLFPRLPWTISKSLIVPLQLLHRLWWKHKKLSEENRILYTTGAFSFIARRMEKHNGKGPANGRAH